MHVDPLLLLGAAEGHEEQVGLGGVDAIADFVVVEVEQRAEGRGIGTGQLEAGMEGAGGAGGLVEVRGGAAEEEDPPALSFGLGEEPGHEVGAGDAFGQRVSEQAGRPDQGHAVAEHQVGIEEDAAQLDVVAGLDHEIHVGSGDVGRVAGADHVGDRGHGVVEGEGVEGDAEDGDGCGGGWGRGGGVQGVAKVNGRRRGHQIPRRGACVDDRAGWAARGEGWLLLVVVLVWGVCFLAIGGIP